MILAFPYLLEEIIFIMGNVSVKNLSYSLIRADDIAIELEEIKDYAVSDDPPIKDISNVVIFLINSGESFKAINVLKQYMPEIIEPGSEVYLNLYVQSYIELIICNQIIDALELFKISLSKYKESAINI